MNARVKPPHALGTAWVLVPSPTVLQVAAAELSTSQTLGAEERGLLLQLTQQPQELCKALRVWVDTAGLQMLQQSKNEQEWRESALRYCVVRQAHYPLLKRLFRASRAEIKLIRDQLGAELPPTKPKQIEPDRLLAIYATWKQLLDEYQSEAERWIKLGDAFPDVSLSSLYSCIVIDGAPVMQRDAAEC